MVYRWQMAYALEGSEEQVRLVDGLDVELVAQLRPDARQQVVQHVECGLSLRSAHHSSLLEKVKLRNKSEMRQECLLPEI